MLHYACIARPVSELEKGDETENRSRLLKHLEGFATGKDNRLEPVYCFLFRGESYRYFDNQPVQKRRNLWGMRCESLL